MATSQDFVNWVCSEAIDYRFLKAILMSERETYPRFASGSVHQTIYYPEVKAFHVCVPPIKEQRAIGSLLGALDDKIDLNRRMNETLEAMARALFKSWFVDAVQASGRFGDLVEIVMGASPPGDTYNEDGIGCPLINGPVEFGELTPVRAKWTTSPVRSCQRDDVVFCVRGSTTGRFVIADGEYVLGRGVAAFRPRPGEEGFLWLLVQMSIGRFLERITGSVFPNLSRDDLKATVVVSPPEEVRKMFSAKVSPLLVKRLRNVEESRTLAALRDTLLPKLLSGELRVKDAERLVGEAV